MPNLYATPTEIKAANPEAFSSDANNDPYTVHDNLIYQLSERISRLIDVYTQRHFYPYSETKYYDGAGDSDIWIHDCFSFTTVSNGTGDYTSDGATMDTDFGDTDYLTFFGEIDSPRGTYNRLIIHPYGSYSNWTDGYQQVQIAGVWCYHSDRADAWEAQGTVQDAPLASDATSLTTTDADAADKWGLANAFQVGQLLRLTDTDAALEYVEVTAVNTTTNVLTIVRGRNGSSGLSIAQNQSIEIWRPEPLVKQVCIIECNRLLQRGLQGFADTRASPELGELLYVASLDPAAQAMLDPLRKMTVAG